MNKVLFAPMACCFILATIFGCVPKKTQIAEPNQHTIQRSDTHILCRLAQDATSSDLAKMYLDSPDKAWMIEDANPGGSFLKGQTVIIPLTIENRAGLFPDGYQMIPILCYHRFAPSCTSQLCIPKNVFIRQMTYLKENRYRVISLQQMVDFLTYNKALPKNSVVITIDDGYRSVYDIAFPILKELGFTATLFIYTDFVSGGSAMTWDQIREMKNTGFEIGSHTLSHADLSQKNSNENQQAYIQRITREIKHSKAILDEKLNQDTLFFAFPFGRSNPNVLEISRQTGYLLGLSVNRGGNPFPTDRFKLYRDQILSRDPAVFVKRLNTFQKISLKDSIHE